MGKKPTWQWVAIVGVAVPVVAVSACSDPIEGTEGERVASRDSPLSTSICAPAPGADCPNLSVLHTADTATRDTFLVSADIFSITQGLTLAPAPDAQIPLAALTATKQLRFNDCPAFDFPYLSPAAAADLKAAAEAHRGNRLLLNAAWRSIATLYVISHSKNPSGVARVGNDPHSVGVSIDLNPRDGGQAKAECNAWCAKPEKSGGCRTRAGCDYQCVAENVFGQNEARDLEAKNFVYSALDTSSAFHGTCNDANHWNHLHDTNSRLKPNAVRAFQRLWNFNHPCDPIEVNGVVGSTGSETYDALGQTPSCGFTYADGPPATGMPGGGCPDAFSASTDTMCCADPADPSGYSCQTSCNGDGGVDSGGDAQDSGSTDSSSGDGAAVDAPPDGGTDSGDSGACSAGASCVIDFDAPNASGGALVGAAVTSYLASFGVTVSATPDVGLNIQQAPFWEPTSSSPNFLNTFGSSADLDTGVTYTLILPGPMTSVSFYRAGIESGSTMGLWSATAYSSTNQPLSTVGENSIVTDVPPQQFTLTGPDIAAITFFSNVEGFAGTYLSIDDLTLTP